MTDEPTKAAIERACEMLGWKVTNFENSLLSLREDHALRRFARHLDQVSETAKRGKAETLDAFEIDDPETQNLVAIWDSLILPDPEPDVLGEVMRSVSVTLPWSDLDSGIFREELRKRGYAITPLKDTRNDR